MTGAGATSIRPMFNFTATSGHDFKAIALAVVARGHTRQQVGAVLQVSPYTVGLGYTNYQQGAGRRWRFAPVAAAPPGWMAEKWRNTRVSRRANSEWRAAGGSCS